MRSLKIVTLNLWGEQGPWQRRLEVVASGLRELGADIVALQEVREVPRSVPNQAQTLAAALGGFHHAFVPSMSWGGGDEGLALLSRYPLAEVRRVELPCGTPDERRMLLSAVVTVEGEAVGCHTTHLNYRMSHGEQRAAQVEAVDRLVQEYRFAGDHPQLLLGDFNASPDCDEIRFLRGRHAIAGRRTYWQDAWAARQPQEPGLTWRAANPHTAALGFLERDRRIDYVFVGTERRDGRGRVLDARVCFEEAVDGVYASDHAGVYAEVAVGPAPVAPPA